MRHACSRECRCQQTPVAPWRGVHKCQPSHKHTQYMSTYIFELDHASIREEEGRVIRWHQAIRWHPRVAILLEILQE